jgi:hypothetical protein
MRVDRVSAPSLYGKMFGRVAVGSCGFPQMKVEVSDDFASMLLMARASSIVIVGMT